MKDWHLLVLLFLERAGPNRAGHTFSHHTLKSILLIRYNLTDAFLQTGGRPDAPVGISAHHTRYFNRFPKIEGRAQSSEVSSINRSEHKK